MYDVGETEETGRMTRGRTYVSGTRMGERRCDTVIICKCLVYVIEFE
jgi:hypothetical protein